MESEALEKLTTLQGIMRGLEGAVVAFSGGVDSTFLLKVAVDVLGPERVIAFIGRSPTCPSREIEEAKVLADLIGARYIVAETSEMDDPAFRVNDKSRCYYCKNHLFAGARRIGEEKGFEHILEGSNVDDMGDYRPGRKACAEHGVLSPLFDAGMTKREIRLLSKQFALPTHDKPAFACLSSRIPYGTKIDVEILAKIEASETFIRSLGVRQVRVRYHHEVARIEVPPEDFHTIMANRAEVSQALRGLGFSHISLDIDGYRMGSMNTF